MVYQKKKKNLKNLRKLKSKEVELLDSNLKEQLKDIVSKFENNIELVVIKDSSVEKSSMIENMVKEISSVSNKLKFISFEKEKILNLKRKLKQTGSLQ